MEEESLEIFLLGGMTGVTGGPSRDTEAISSLSCSNPSRVNPRRLEAELCPAGGQFPP